MTREEQLACLTGRPCTVCSKHTEKGCSSWNCIFEEKPEDAGIISQGIRGRREDFQISDE